MIQKLDQDRCQKIGTDLEFSEYENDKTDDFEASIIRKTVGK